MTEQKAYTYDLTDDCEWILENKPLPDYCKIPATTLLTQTVVQMSEMSEKTTMPVMERRRRMNREIINESFDTISDIDVIMNGFMRIDAD